MQNRDYANTSLPAMLWEWGMHRLSQRLAAMKPEHSALEAAVAAAESGNPTGA